MNIRLKTLDEVESFINKVNKLLGYPDGRGTETYCNIPEVNNIVDNDLNIIDYYYEVPITQELNCILVNIAAKIIIND